MSKTDWQKVRERMAAATMGHTHVCESHGWSGTAPCPACEPLDQRIDALGARVARVEALVGEAIRLTHRIQDAA